MGCLTTSSRMHALEQLDLLLMHEVRTRKVRPDGIHFQSLRYLSLTLAAYVGEEVTIRFDPRDMGEIRVFYKNRFLCRTISAELACRFANYLANFFASYMAHSCVWTSFPQFRKRRARSPCSASKCCGSILRGSGLYAPWLLKPQSPTEQP